MPPVGVDPTTNRLKGDDSAVELQGRGLEPIRHARERHKLTTNVRIRTFSVMQTSSEPLLTTDQVADLLQISRRSVERLEESGKLPSVRLGRLVRYRREDVESLIAGERSA